MDKLQNARASINAIDQKIAKLFEQRMDAVKEVALYKKENNMEILDSRREEELLNRNCTYIQNQEYLDYYRKFQQNMMNVSKEYQQEIIKEEKL